jgi:hypothetical protein
MEANTTCGGIWLDSRNLVSFPHSVMGNAEICAI